MSLSKLKRLANPFFFFLGLILLFFLIQKFGVHEFVNTFRLLGYNIGYILFLPLLWYFFQAAAWYFTIHETGSHVSLGTLLAIKLSGESINTLTPISFMGGDPVRIYMLQKKMPATLSTASVILDRTVQSLAVVLLVVSGLMVAWKHLELPPIWRISFPILTLLMFVFVWIAIHHQREGFFNFASRVLTRLGVKRHLTGKIQGKIKELDSRISHFYRNDPKRFLWTLALHFLGRLVGVVEIYIIAFFLDVPLTWSGALFLCSLSVLVNMVFVFVPGSMGVMEGAYGALFHLLGLNPAAGVAVQLVRRVRTIFWIFIGLIPMMNLKFPKPRDVSATVEG